jgi:alkyl hydroperoxide reductase subunit AhpC
MKIKIIVLVCVISCLVGLDGWLLYTNYKNKIIVKALNEDFEKVSALYDVEYLYKVSKELIKLQLRYEQYPLNNCEIYTGSDTSKIMSIKTLINKPKLIFGSSGNMCPPCIETVIEQLREIIPDYSHNDDIIFVADIEKRLKNNYYDKQVFSFCNKKDFPLYKIGAPYLFVLDEDMVIKMLFITNKSTPELTSEYLKTIKRLYFP